MSGGQSIDVSKLNVQQLTYLTKQLEEENTLLTANFNQLKVAQAKFLDAAACMKVLGEERERKEILVPLTSSLYVPGTLDPAERVLVDIGTGFFVGKSASAAEELLQKKASLLKQNTDSLYKVIIEKRENLDVAQETLELRKQQD